ncbi:hypothetical protein ACFSL6_17575 [Paenibacillus thailandensis]|uniref:DUF1275 domain-containing protein n=1 Tax=Paenibacillus thailandensis TaxID=393250 RepID=A0ABW5R2C2_9BACL
MEWNWVEFIGFMVFSTIEGLGILALMLKIFCYKFFRHVGPSLIIITIMNLQSYFLREEFSLSNVVPVIQVLLFVLLLTAIIKMPIFASLIVSVVGFFVFATIQSVIVGVTPNDYLSISEVQTVPYKGYLLQTLTAIFDFAIASILNFLRLGFIQDLNNKLKCKYERLLVTLLTIGILMTFGYILLVNNAVIHIIFFFIAALIFLYYAYKKETTK